MARRGLTMYSDPIASGIDAYAKMNNTFMAQDELDIRKKEAVGREETRQLENRRLNQQIEEYDAGAETRELERGNKEREFLMKKLKGPLESANVKFFQAKKQGTVPTYDATEIDALMTLQKQNPLLSDDPEEAKGQVAALVGLQQKMATLAPQLKQQAAQLPEGQRRVAIKDPELIQFFNTAFNRSLNKGTDRNGKNDFTGKAVESFLVDLDAGTVTPVVNTVSADGTTDRQALTVGRDNSPDAEMYRIPLAVLQSYVGANSEFGSMLLPALAQVQGDGKILEEVRKHAETREENMIQEKALAEVDTAASVSEQRKQFMQGLAKHGSKSTLKDRAALAKEFIADKQKRNLTKMEEGAGPNQKREVLVDQETGEVVREGKPMKQFKDGDGDGSGGGAKGKTNEWKEYRNTVAGVYAPLARKNIKDGASDDGFMVEEKDESGNITKNYNIDAIKGYLSPDQLALAEKAIKYGENLVKAQGVPAQQAMTRVQKAMYLEQNKASEAAKVAQQMGLAEDEAIAEVDAHINELLGKGTPRRTPLKKR